MFSSNHHLWDIVKMEKNQMRKTELNWDLGYLPFEEIVQHLGVVSLD